MRNQLSFCAIRDILISIQKSLFRRHIYLFCCQISLFGHKMFHIHFTEWPQHLMARWFRTRKKKNAALQMSNAKKSSQSVCLSTSYEAICELLHCSQQLSWYGHLLPAGAFTHSGRLSSHCGLEFSCLGVDTELARKLYHLHDVFRPNILFPLNPSTPSTQQPYHRLELTLFVKCISLMGLTHR